MSQQMSFAEKMAFGIKELEEGSIDQGLAIFYRFLLPKLYEIPEVLPTLCTWLQAFDKARKRPEATEKQKQCIVKILTDTDILLFLWQYLPKREEMASWVAVAAWMKDIPELWEADEVKLHRPCVTVGPDEPVSEDLLPFVTRTSEPIDFSLFMNDGSEEQHPLYPFML